MADIPNQWLPFVGQVQKDLADGKSRLDALDALDAKHPEIPFEVLTEIGNRAALQASIAGQVVGLTPDEALSLYNTQRQAQGESTAYEVSATLSYPTGAVDREGKPIMGHVQVRVDVKPGDTIADIEGRALEAAKEIKSPKGTGQNVTVENPMRYVY